MNSEQILSTEHPYIVKALGVCGGRPIIRGTRTPVQAIVEYYRLGMDASQILTELPHITAAQLHDALSYFYDHKEEIEAGIDADHQIIRQHHKETTRNEVVTAS